MPPDNSEGSIFMLYKLLYLYLLLSLSNPFYMSVLSSFLYPFLPPLRQNSLDKYRSKHATIRY
jgi:hypothetical protein